ncbi:MAG: hypothetical protein J6T98_08695 [Salinivirgaceae bacterium]|nr:hypothetical protein [Salinivirgaceae bacterium]
MIRKPIFLIPVSLSYAILAWFVYFVINPLCYNIFQQPAFVLTTEFFCKKMSAIGGLAEYLQTFIDQFTMFRFWGTMLLVAELFVTAFLVARYVRKITGNIPYVTMLAFILPVAISIVAWTDIRYSFAINMQVLLLALALNLQQAISKYNWHNFVVPLLAVAVYHACGAVALYTFTVCNIVAYILSPDKRKLVGLVSVVVVTILWPLLVYNFMLPVRPANAFYDVRPQEQMFIVFDLKAVLYMLFVYVPALVIVGNVYNRYAEEKKTNLITLASVVLIAVCTVFFQQKRDNYPERVGYKMEVAAYNKDWNQILNYVKNNSELKDYGCYNQKVNFYYNMALAVKGQLPDKMFSYPQRMGINGLFVDDPIATVICLPTTILFDQMGFTTDALHYAFEAQTTYENSHYIMRYVIDNLLVIGDYYNVSKYLEKYKHVMLSGKYVKNREKYLNGIVTNLDGKNVESIRKKHPKRDFYMGNSQYDVLQVVMTDKDNAFASQYLFASALLQNDLDLFYNLLLRGYGNLNYNNLPRAYQEAIVLYRSFNKSAPGLDKLNIQSFIVEQFKSFQNVVSDDRSDIREIVQDKFANTYWKYYFFDNPKATEISVE